MGWAAIPSTDDLKSGHTSKLPTFVSPWDQASSTVLVLVTAREPADGGGRGRLARLFAGRWGILHNYVGTCEHGIAPPVCHTELGISASAYDVTGGRHEAGLRSSAREQQG